MSYIDRNTILQSAEFQAQVRMALTDWLNYWATTGTGSIEDPDLREKTDMYIKFCVSNLDTYAKSLSVLVAGEDDIAGSTTVTDAKVNAGVTHVLATALDYLL